MRVVGPDGTLHTVARVRLPGFSPAHAFVASDGTWFGWTETRGADGRFQAFVARPGAAPGAGHVLVRAMHAPAPSAAKQRAWEAYRAHRPATRPDPRRDERLDGDAPSLF